MTMDWPWQYSFPPFFTRQPNDDTRLKQFDAWADLILRYCETKRVWQLDIANAATTELFNNKKLARKCSTEFIVELIDNLVKRGHAEWISPGGALSPSKSNKTAPVAKTSCFILWNTVDEWAKLIYEYVDRNAMRNSVQTFYDLTEARETRGEKFHLMDKRVLKKALHVLQAQSKAEIFQADGNEEPGVKFF